ncbi:MAG: ribosomal protein [Chloroflexi bacterium]|jgi:large subunit ribosomal protein L15|nr:ribosomal protein [Chloroflexota bacterium]
MKQHDLQPAVGSTTNRKRVGRGYGSGSVKTSGRGQKGQKARTGHSKMPAWFEGSPSKTNSIKRQGYKRGVSFSNPNHVAFEVINLGKLADLDGNEFTPATLIELGLIKSTPSAVLPQKIITLLGGKEIADTTTPLVKILGVGEISRAITVHAHRFSASAKQKIEAAGGQVVELMAWSEGKGPQAQAQAEEPAE